MNEVRAAVDNKEQAMLAKINQISEAKLKTLELHVSNVNMIQECVQHMVAECERLIESADGAQVRKAQL